MKYVRPGKPLRFVKFISDRTLLARRKYVPWFPLGPFIKDVISRGGGGLPNDDLTL